MLHQLTWLKEALQKYIFGVQQCFQFLSEIKSCEGKTIWKKKKNKLGNLAFAELPNLWNIFFLWFHFFLITEATIVII